MLRTILCQYIQQFRRNGQFWTDTNYQTDIRRNRKPEELLIYFKKLNLELKNILKKKTTYPEFISTEDIVLILHKFFQEKD